MTPEALITYLSRAGPQPTGVILSDLRVPRASLHRARTACGLRVLVRGRTRATVLAARRAVDGVAEGPIPLYAVDQRGLVTEVAALTPVEPFGYLVDADRPPSFSFHASDVRAEAPPRGLDLPWFLSDLKPQGYLGRAWLARHPYLGFPPSLTRWTGDDVLRFLVHHGADLPGALFVGPHARAAFEGGRCGGPLLDAADWPSRLIALADDAAASGGGSSLGGEQPKVSFAVRADGGGVIHRFAKFSPPIDQAAGRRWADLLVAEHLALQTLCELGFDVARSEILDAGGRRFLVLDRFDRHGARGRSGIVSLHPFDVGGAGQDLRSWSLVTRRLRDQGRLSPDDHDRVVWLEAFGHAIANTDMHLGNLSLRLDGLRIAGIAPVYDMLPMHFAPGPGGEVREDPYRGGTPIVASAEAREAARRFWARCASDTRMSERFREIAGEHGRGV
jgi:hypothetical protein